MCCPCPVAYRHHRLGHPERVVKRLGTAWVHLPHRGDRKTGPILAPALSTQKLGREPINLPGGRLAEVRYAPIATIHSERIDAMGQKET